MGKTLVLDETTVKSIYKTASKSLKEKLEGKFGKKIFLPSLKERVNSIEDVYKELGRYMPTVNDYKFLPKEKRERALNSQYIDDIAELFNDGWKPDFLNNNQYKYYPYFRKNSSGWFLCVVFGYNDGSSLGSGFYFKDKDTANLVVSKFMAIYSKVLD